MAVIDSGTDLYFLYLKVIYFILSMLTLAAIDVIAYTYCYIFSESRRQKRRLQTELLPEEAKKLKKERKAATTLTLIVGTLVITYIPTIVLLLVMDTQKIFWNCIILSVIWCWVATFRLLGSLCNRIIFFWRVKKLRLAILEILHYRQPENTPPSLEIKRYRPEIQPSTTKAFSGTVKIQEPVQLSFSNTDANFLNLHIDKATKTSGNKQLFYETNFKPKLFTANVECNGTVIKLPKTEKPILFLNFKFSLNGGDLVFLVHFQPRCRLPT